jgi:hypothetical protein
VTPGRRQRKSELSGASETSFEVEAQRQTDGARDVGAVDRDARRERAAARLERRDRDLKGASERTDARDGDPRRDARGAGRIDGELAATIDERGWTCRRAVYARRPSPIRSCRPFASVCHRPPTEEARDRAPTHNVATVLGGTNFFDE